MPFYDFTCLDCGNRFEMMRPMSQRDDGVTCPACGGKEARRELPRIHALVSGSGPTGAVPGCDAGGGGCGAAGFG
jgi:putative FmdB family regulatory protein